MTDPEDDATSDPNAKRTTAALIAATLLALTAIPSVASAADAGVSTSEDPITVCVWASDGGFYGKVCFHAESGYYNCGYISTHGDLEGWDRGCRKLMCKIHDCWTK